jgi:hypothetical protein
MYIGMRFALLCVNWIVKVLSLAQNDCRSTVLISNVKPSLHHTVTHVVQCNTLKS